MSNIYGMFTKVNGDGSVTTSRVKYYQTYSQMVEDNNPGVYGVVGENNTVYHKTDAGWVVGFPNINDESTYSAFEVYAHDTEIPVGDCEALGGYVTNAIPAEMTHKFMIRLEGDVETNDVIVDWGDGSTSSIANGDYEQIIDYKDTYGSKDLLLGHTYSTTGKYIIKIFGKNYYTFRNHLAYFIDADTGNKYVSNTGKHNIVCRILERDLPIASHVTTHASMFRSSRHLLNVVVDATNSFYNSKNINSCFYYCDNLLTAYGFNGLAKDCNCGSVFYEDRALQKTDFVIPSDATNVKSVLTNCQSLEYSINSLFSQKVYTHITSFTDAFYGCKKLTGIIDPNIFWNNKYITWVDGASGNHYRTFHNCTLINSQAPLSWGGTASNDIIEKRLEEQLDELESRVEALETTTN